MQLSGNQTATKKIPAHNPWHVHQLRKPGIIIDPAEIVPGGHYIYKEKHGVVAIVKVLEDISQNDWIGFRLMVKRVLYSPWPIKAKTLFEAGYYSKFGYPSSWHFEAYLNMVK